MIISFGLCDHLSFIIVYYLLMMMQKLSSFSVAFFCVCELMMMGVSFLGVFSQIGEA